MQSKLALVSIIILSHTMLPVTDRNQLVGATAVVVASCYMAYTAFDEQVRRACPCPTDPISWFVFGLEGMGLKPKLGTPVSPPDAKAQQTAAVYIR